MPCRPRCTRRSPSNSAEGSRHARANQVGTALVFRRQLENLGFHKEVEEPRVEELRIHFLTDNIQGAFDGDGTFVGAVTGRQGVVNIGDGHYLGLKRNVFGLHAVRVAASIQFFVMGLGDVGNVLQFPGPRNLAEEAETVDDVGLNLHALVSVQTAFRNGE